ncbi:hypothetical protein Tco_0242179, partial [Tanacetum coccineum]
GISKHEKTCNNDKNLSEIQLEHEKEDEFVMVVVKVVHECRDCMMVVKEIVSRLLEEEKRSWNGGLSKTLMKKKNRMKRVMVVVRCGSLMI